MSEDRLHIDFESRSRLDLTKVGTVIYANEPTTSCWCFAWAFNHEKVALWEPGQKIPKRIIDHIASGGTVSGFSVQFEFFMWSVVLPRQLGIELPPLTYQQLDCTQARAVVMGLPRNLDALAGALDQGHHRMAKDASGRRLMLQMARPRHVAPDGTLTWWDDPDRRHRLGLYCMQDVEVERFCERFLRPLTPKHRQYWEMDFRMNFIRGIQIDTHLVEQSRDVLAVAAKHANRQLRRITGGACTGIAQLQGLRAWLATQGVDTPSLDKEHLQALLDSEDVTGKAREALQLRQDFGKASLAKIAQFIRRTADDGRMHGMLLFNGAGPGRWTGQGAQLHNLPRPELNAKSVEYVIRTLRNTSYTAQEKYDLLEMVFGAVLPAMADAIRGFIVSQPRHKLLIRDFSQIEGRCIARIAGERWKIDAYAAFDAGHGPDLYRMAASKAFGIPVEKVDDRLRQAGKVMELSCLGPDTRVLTSNGWKCIIHVLRTDLLWDGVEWVRHEGLVFQGVKQVLTLRGVEITPNHLVLIGNRWVTAEALEKADRASTRCCQSARSSASCAWLDMSLATATPYSLNCNAAAAVSPTSSTPAFSPSTKTIAAASAGESCPPRSGINPPTTSAAPTLIPQAASSRVSYLSQRWATCTGRALSLTLFVGLKAALKRSWCLVPAALEFARLLAPTFNAAKRICAAPARLSNQVLLEKQIMVLSQCWPTTSTAIACSGESTQVFAAAPTQKTKIGRIMAVAASPCTRRGLRTDWPIWPTFSPCPAGMTQPWSLIGSKTTKATNRAISGSSPKPQTWLTGVTPATSKPSLPILKPVYDLRNAGPRNRFTILTDSGPLIVHNCGFGGGAPALNKMARKYGINLANYYEIVSQSVSRAVVTKAEWGWSVFGFKTGIKERTWLTAEMLKLAWRETNPAIVELWDKLDEAAISAVREPKKVFSYRGVSFQLGKIKGIPYLMCQLPSSRILYYPYATWVELTTPWGAQKESVRFMGINPLTRKWSASHGRGGLWAENITQGDAFDFIAAAMLRCEDAGFPPVLSVHDENVAEAPETADDQLYGRLMAERPPWARGMPLAADGFSGPRYAKK